MLGIGRLDSLVVVLLLIFPESSPSLLSWQEIKQAGPLAPSPAARQSPAFASTSHGLFIHGGCASSACTSMLSDTWILNWDTMEWQELGVGAASSRVSPARYGASAVASPPGVVLFGGATSTSALDDVWLFQFSNESWVRLTPGSSSGPSARKFAPLIDFPVLGCSVLLGGLDFSGTPQGDTWLLTNTSTTDWYWSQYQHLGVQYDSGAGAGTALGDTLYLFGGFSGATQTSNALWALAPPFQSWSKILPSHLPSARIHAAAAGLTGHFVLFGGETSTGDVLDDTWVYTTHEGSWTQITTSQSPPGMSLGAVGVNGNRVVVFGGRTSTGPTNSVWKLTMRALHVDTPTSSVKVSTSDAQIRMALPPGTPVGSTLNVFLSCQGCFVTPNPLRLDTTAPEATCTISVGPDVGVLQLASSLSGSLTPYLLHPPISITVKGDVRIIDPPRTVRLGRGPVTLHLSLTADVPPSASLILTPYGLDSNPLLRPFPPHLTFSSPSTAASMAVLDTGAVGWFTLQLKATGDAGPLFDAPPPLRLAVVANMTLSGPRTTTAGYPTEYVVRLGAPTLRDRDDDWLGIVVHANTSVVSPRVQRVPHGTTTVTFLVAADDVGPDALTISVSTTGIGAELYILPPPLLVNVQPDPLHQEASRGVVAFAIYLSVTLLANVALRKYPRPVVTTATAYVIWLFLGLGGVHRSYFRRYQTAGLLWLTLGGLGLVWAADFPRIPNMAREAAAESMAAMHSATGATSCGDGDGVELLGQEEMGVEEREEERGGEDATPEVGDRDDDSDTAE